MLFSISQAVSAFGPRAEIEVSGWYRLLYIQQAETFVFYIYNKCLPVGFDGASVFSVVSVVEYIVGKDDMASPFRY